MKILHLFKKNESPKEPVNALVEKIQKGDKALREKFISDYNRFIIKTVSNILGKYIEIENSEEYSIGLLAFNEAIDSYDPKRNTNFFNFCEQVIRRRIIDYLRSTQKDRNVYTFSQFDDEEHESKFEEQYLRSDSSYAFENIEIKEEIIAFKEKLSEFGITLKELVLISPKHKDSMKMATNIGRKLAQNDALFNKMMKTKNLPIVELLKEVDVSRKTVEKYRKFIIAVSLILKSNLDDLKTHIRDLEEGGKDLV
ncbi:MAG: RNA polymerase sigma-I factor [Clostridia bacterium]|nr:RNA polymerase sigma-I factor [Clostridia bacterium]